MSFNNEGEQFAYQQHPEGDQSRRSKGSKQWIAAAAAVAVVAALAVGGVALVSALGGGGAQPEDVMPANAIAFAKLDLNPSAGQKLAVYQLAAKFPATKGKVTSEESSVKETVFGSIFTGDTGWGLDYAKDVEPWLGDRIGVGVFPDMDADKTPEFALAIAYSDQSAAKAALDKATANAAKNKDKVGYAFADDFVMVSDTSAHATALVTSGKSSALAASRYSEDVKKLESDQIGVAWSDIAALYKAIPQDLDVANQLGLKGGAGDPKNASGRVVVGLHADSTFVELNAKGIDIVGVDALVKAEVGAGTAMMTSFPADVFGAVTVNGLGKLVGGLYTSLTGSGDPMEIKPTLGALGITSASQLETLLGSAMGVVVGGTVEQMEYAVRTQGGDADAAYSLASKLLETPELAGAGVVVNRVKSPDGIVVGFGAGLTGALTSGSGSKLSSSETFTQVMPGIGDADFAAYVNLAKLLPLVAKDSPEDAASLKALNAFGLTANRGAQPTVRLRLSFK